MKKRARLAGGNDMLAFLFLFFVAADTPPKDAAPATPSLSVSEVAPPEEPEAVELGQVRRIYVDVFTGGESAAQLRDEIINALERSKLFTITENEDRADAVLKGAAKDEAYTDTFRSSDNANGRSQYGTSQGESYGKYVNDRSSRNIGGGLGDSDSVDIAERRHEARAAVRLVSADGDVIWSTTAESQGAKFLSASEDVAQRVAKKLSSDWHRQRTAPETH